MRRTAADTFELRYRLTGIGWSEAVVADEHHRTVVTASHISDALALLIDAVATVAEDDSESRCSWEEEPGEHRWVLRRTGDVLAVQVLSFASSQGAADIDGAVIFETEQPVLRVARAVFSAAQQLLDDLGPERYLDEWARYPFPFESLERLRRALPR